MPVCESTRIMIHINIAISIANQYNTCHTENVTKCQSYCKYISQLFSAVTIVDFFVELSLKYIPNSSGSIWQ